MRARSPLPVRRWAAGVAFVVVLGTVLSAPAADAKLTALKSPLPKNAARVPEALLNSVACTSPGNCVAVGRYESGVVGRALIVSEVKFKWGSPKTIRMPHNARSGAFGVLNAVRCRSVGNCVAVGQYETSQSGKKPTYSVVNQPLVVSEVKGKWHTGIEVKLPQGAINGSVTALNGVSCPKKGYCVAVGQFITALGNEAFSLHESGTKWLGARTLTLKAYARSNFITQLDAISCVAVGYCVAVGQFANGAPARQPLVAQMAKGVWSVGHAVPVPSSVRNPWAGLFSIDCLSWGTCVAVGVVSSPPAKGQGLIEVETNGKWHRGILAPLPKHIASDAVGDQLLSVSCYVYGSCDAVGQYTDGATDEGVSIIETKGKWGAATIVPRPKGAISPPYAGLNGIACKKLKHVKKCVMVGQYQSGGGDPALIVHQ